ncbi:MAG: hypothetical protein HYR67_17965 [Bacteroidetes bacterium]|nr:hypothetical protein [Bacteroidota bacterium]
MKNLIDVVNLNADASCLSSKWWLEILRGGKSSYLYQWLSIYINNSKKVSLGITGATVSDIANFNPESIDLINKNKQIFEIVLRPYSHDIGLLRTKLGFEKNLEFGIKVLKKEFGSFANYFLPPEFMLTNEQIQVLTQSKVEGVFINPVRFKKEMKLRLPSKPYIIKGVFDVEMKCIPFFEGLTAAYLNSLHFFECKEWNKIIEKSRISDIYSWRDGESSFFVPDGNERENTWLKKESKRINRLFLGECIPKTNFISNDILIEKQYHYYPVHSFTAWVKEFRMLGFINKIKSIENNLANLSVKDISLWLQVINSDILSAIEKDSPVVNIKGNEKSLRKTRYTIWRSERGVEGEEMLSILENKNLNIWAKSLAPHAIKLNERLKYLHNLS